MLDREDACGEGGLVVGREHWHDALNQDRAGVECPADEVDGAAVGLDAGFERAGVSVEAGEGGQQEGWMLSRRSCQRSTKPAVRMRMKPARQTRSIAAA